MTNRKPENNVRRELVTEARAGLIPECDDIEDERRARIKRTARLIRTLKAHARLPTCGSEHQIIDLMADLRHYCQQYGLPFEKLDWAGYELHLEEKAGWQDPVA